MEEKNKNEYKVKEILNDNGKDIKTLLRETFREYCEDYLQKKYL